MADKKLFNFSDGSLRKIQDINQDFIRKTSFDIPTEAWQTKWKKLMDPQKGDKGAMSFFRSFVRCYYVDLGYAEGAYMGLVSPAFGDAHLENFGFNVFADNSVRFVYNDFDDSGYCPVGLDAVRYFTVLRLLKVHDKKIKQLIKYYSKLVTAQNAPDFKELSSNWKINNKSIYDLWDPEKRLKKAIKEFKKCPQTDGQWVDDIKESFKRKKKLRNYKVHDVRDYDEHETGGSGGLLRFWVHVKDNQDNEDILEFKQLTINPGVGHQWNVDPHFDKRIKWCATHLWPSIKRKLDLQVALRGYNFQVRSRVKKTLKPKSDDEKTDLWKIQLDIMAAHHYSGWSGHTEDEVKTWLKTNSEYIARRYTDIFENCKNQTETSLSRL